MNKLTILVLAVVALSWAAAQSDVEKEWENYKVNALQTKRWLVHSS